MARTFQSVDKPVRMAVLWTGIMFLILSGGCTLVASWGHKSDPIPNPVLRPVKMKSDAVVLDIFFVRRSQNDTVLNDAVWRDSRDSQFSPELRQQLRINGFRIGVLSSRISDQLSDLLELSNKQPGKDAKPIEGQIDVSKKQNVLRRYVELSEDRPTEILSSDVYNELTVLTKDGSGIGGKSYYDAQCVFHVDCQLLPKGSVRLNIQPEVQYGQSRQQYTVQQGVVQFDFGRNKSTFPTMDMSVELNLGEMLILSCEPGRSGSLGSHFFADLTKENYQKLLVIRLARTQHDSLFPESGLRPDEQIPVSQNQGPPKENPVKPLVVNPVMEGENEETETELE